MDFLFYDLEMLIVEKVTKNIILLIKTVQIKDYNVMIDGRKFFDQPIKNGWKDCNGKIAKGQRDDCTTEFIFKKYYKLIAIDLSRQRKPNADSKAIQQINFSGNLY